MTTLATAQQTQSAFPPMIGVITRQLHNPFHQKLLSELSHQLNARGAVLVLLNAETDEQALIAQLERTRSLALRGLLVLPGGVSDRQLTVVCATASCPVLAIGAEQGIEDDARLAGVGIGRLLLAAGHQRFGYLQGHAGLSPQKQGYSSSLIAANCEISADLVAGDDDREQAYQAVTGYLKRTRAAGRIQALFCESDLLAFGAMQAIRDFGQGAHVAVAGFGDVDEARSSTWHLTSWAVNTGRVINHALNQLLEPGADESKAGWEGTLQIRHSHFGKSAPEAMSECGCAHRH